LPISVIIHSSTISLPLLHLMAFCCVVIEGIVKDWLMIQDKVIYTDGRDVTVTDSTLKVKNTSYQINGITKLRMWTIHPDRWPAVLLMLIGIGASICGYLGYVPANLNLRTDNGVISGGMLFLWGGIALAVIALLMLVLVHDRYAVRIATAEGEKNAIVSSKREYIQQIVDALNRSFDFERTTTGTLTTDQSRTVIR